MWLMEGTALGIFKFFKRNGKSTERTDGAHSAGQMARRCQFERMEPRQVLSANPVVAGITYLETDGGEDRTPDYFEVTFSGGSPTTLMTQFVINGDQDGNGTRSTGDMIFHVNSAIAGAAESHPFQFVADRSLGVSASDVLGVQISDDGLRMTVLVKNFVSGDRLAFSLDVDEIENRRVDKIASGVEFESTLFSAQFSDPHYNFNTLPVSLSTILQDGQQQTQTGGMFFDEYDKLLAHAEQISGGTLDLIRDNEQGNMNRNDSAIDAWSLTPKPIEMSGKVYHDENADCIKDNDEQGIANVDITLQRFNESSGTYETVSTTRTDASGNYRFGTDLGLQPGKFRIVEVQPDGYLSVGAATGKVDGNASGVVDSRDVLSEIDVPLGGTVAENYDFCEIRPASLSGHVWHDRNDNGNLDAGEERIANVLIKVTRTGAKPGSAADPFSDTAPVFVRTNANGQWSVDGLPPGVYQAIEINNYPESDNPLAGYLDGKDSLGQVNGNATGEKTNDQFNGILLCAGEEGIEYNFGELRPASVSGYVSVATPEGDCLDPSHPAYRGISGVQMQLFDSSGKLVATTTTAASGFYEFLNLAPGTYSVVEVQPEGYLDGAESIGSVNNVPTGVNAANDRIAGIRVGSGDAGVRYDFCEHVPAQIKGNVWHDRNNDGVINNGEQGIANVTIRLFDKSNSLVAETQTDAQGAYSFLNLMGGEYTIREVQPADYFDGKDGIGTVNGNVTGEKTNDVFTKVVVLGGQTGIEYNFGEIRLASVEGFVHVDADGNCIYDTSKGDKPIAGVTLQLLDANGQVIGTTLTDASGHYSFGELMPGQYSVRQVQPDGYFTAGEKVGSGSGTAATNEIRGIVLSSGDQLANYNFCEELPAAIEGRVWEDGPAFRNEDGLVPEGYRDMRDGVFTSGVDTPIPGTIMELWFYIDPVTEEIAPRRVTLGEVLNLNGNYDHLGGNADSPVWVRSGADGQYSFRGLKAGSYLVLQQQPSGYVDANEIVGSTTGFSFNSEEEADQAPQAVLSQFSQDQIMDSLVNVYVNAGGVSVQNNFTEVRAVAEVPEKDPLPLGPPALPPGFGNPLTPLPPPGYGPGLAGHQAANFTAYIGGGRGIAVEAAQPGYTWHLSVINNGQPRGGESETSTQWMQAGFLSDSDWTRFDMLAGEWTFTEMSADGTIKKLDERGFFGMVDGIPVVGDWNGDGIDQIGVFHGGYWLLDVNGDGKWDADDMILRLGEEGDRPVTGDWDGDAKDDIGIYGPMWDGDPEAIEQDPGIPDPDNRSGTRPKNVPPQIVEATDGTRVMRLSSFGNSRADVIDHVFGYGEEDDVPVTGDWNGDGIRTIGVFRGGVWHLDRNGDGILDNADLRVSFGQAGDIPLVGDFNGDGIEELAVFRNGRWIIDTNGNHEIDAADKVFELGSQGDLPVVGDWNNDGIDDPAVYRAHSNQARIQ